MQTRLEVLAFKLEGVSSGYTKMISWTSAVMTPTPSVPSPTCYSRHLEPVLTKRMPQDQRQILHLLPLLAQLQQRRLPTPPIDQLHDPRINLAIIIHAPGLSLGRGAHSLLERHRSRVRIPDMLLLLSLVLLLRSVVELLLGLGLLLKEVGLKVLLAYEGVLLEHDGRAGWLREVRSRRTMVGRGWRLREAVGMLCTDWCAQRFTSGINVEWIRSESCLGAGPSGGLFELKSRCADCRYGVAGASFPEKTARSEMRFDVETFVMASGE